MKRWALIWALMLCFITTVGSSGCTDCRALVSSDLVKHIPVCTPSAQDDHPCFEEIVLHERSGCGIVAGRMEVACWNIGYGLGLRVQLEYDLKDLVLAPKASTSWVFSSEVEEVALGQGYFCALLASGSIKCVIDGGEQVSWFPADELYAGLSASGTRVCALTRDDGSTYCYSTLHKKLNQGPLGVYMLDVDGLDACGVFLDGAVRCWGAQGDVSPVQGHFREVSWSAQHGLGCALDADGEATCWGALGFYWAGTFMRTLQHMNVGKGPDGALCMVDLDGEGMCWSAQGMDLAHGGWPGPWRALHQSNIGCGIHQTGALLCWGLDGF